MILQLLWTVLLWLALLPLAQAASFDCAKAKSEVERLICQDPELSKLDEELAKAYAQALAVAEDPERLQQEQRAWVREQRRCGEVGCLKKKYFERLSIMPPSPKSPLCQKILGILRSYDGGRHPERVPRDFYVEYQKDFAGLGDRYSDLDIDGDGISDCLLRSCGEGLQAACTLFVDLSTGIKYEIDETEGRFFLARLNNNIYAIYGDASDSEEQKCGRRFIRKITKHDAILICDSI